MKNVEKKILILIIVLLLAIITNSKYNMKAVNGDEWNNYGVYDDNLYAETTKYKFIRSTSSDDIIPGTYDLTKITTQNVVASGEPLLTILTPGLGSDASDWSNVDNKLGYNENSIINRFYKINSNYNIYLFDISSSEDNLKNTHLEIYDLGNQIRNGLSIGEEFDISESSKLTDSEGNCRITDATNPILILFQTSNKNRSNEIVYRDFNYALCKALYDIKKLNNGLLVKMNLIGHSRGGITNLQFALDHPEVVYSMFSIGTPFLGSSTGEIDYNCLESEFVGNCREGEYDIVSSNIFNDYYYRWNSGYNKYYNCIKVKTLGCTTPLDNMMENIDLDPADTIAGISTRTITKYYSKLLELLYKKDEDPEYYASKMAFYTALLYFEFGNELTDRFLNIINNEIKLKDGILIWENDVLVDLGSQIGEKEINNSLYKYKGFESIKITYTDIDYKSINPTRVGQPKVTHNLEIGNELIINYILSEIEIKDINRQLFEYVDVGNNNIAIKAFLGKYNNSTLYIPKVIDGKTVTQIGKYCLSNNFNGHNNINSVYIPNTIQYIDEGAFKDCLYLENVVFEENSQLAMVSDFAFMNCENLSSCIIPQGAHFQDFSVYKNCPKLIEFTNLEDSIYILGDINCCTNEILKRPTIYKYGYAKLYFNVSCSSTYEFSALDQENAINMCLVNYDGDVLKNFDILNDNSSNSFKIKLDKGDYILKIKYKNNVSGKPTIKIKTFGQVEYDLNLGDNNVLEHFHNHKIISTFIPNNSSFYRIKLKAKNNGVSADLDGIIKILHNGQICKLNLLNLANENIAYQATIDEVFMYLHENEEYMIIVEEEYAEITEAFIEIKEVNSFNISQNDNFTYENNEESLYNMNMIEIKRNGIYKISITYPYSFCDVKYELIKINKDKSLIDTLIYETLGSNQNEIEIEEELNENDIIYFGFYNRITSSVTISINRVVSKNFNLNTDLNENVTVGSHVRLNGGSYNQNDIKQGYTRVCYLGNNAPEKISRKNYYWYSLDEKIAIVSDFGTVTAVADWKDNENVKSVKILAVYKNDPSIIGQMTFYIEKDNSSKSIKILEYGMDVRIDGAVGTEVSEGKGQKIPLSETPYVSIHVGYTRLICLGDDAPSNLIQNYEWSIMDNQIASISNYGTIKGLKKGTTIIIGRYKYNDRLYVYLPITVL